jgi:hypothetical protein
VCNSTSPLDSTLVRLIVRIQKEEKRLELVNYYHVLRAQNHQANVLGNEASCLEEGSSRIKNGIMVSSIPCNIITTNPKLSMKIHSYAKWWSALTRKGFDFMFKVLLVHPHICRLIAE